MSTAKENSCRKFQANFFNKSKCQNCFKPRELHLLTDQDLTQAKPIYGGWLCLAPEGTDFDNPMQRSRKWQRRFFVLYEHGCLRFALDESPSTLPQGTVNMNACTDVIDAEPKTGQKNSLCIITPEQEYFIRGENKEIINGWTEQLVVYPRTNKQNQKKKRKVEPTTSQEPGPAKVAVTGLGIPEAEKVLDSSSIIWQEELNQREAEAATVWASAELPLGSPLPHPTGECTSVRQGSDAGSVNGDEVDQGSLALHGSAPQPPADLLSPTGSCSSLGGVPRCLSPAPSDPFPSGSSLLSNGSHISGSVSSLDSDASGSTVTSTESHPSTQRGNHSFSHHDTPRSRRLEAEARKAEKRSRFRSPDREAVLSPERSRSGVIEKLEALELENPVKMEVDESHKSGARQGRSELRRFQREEQRSTIGQGLVFPSSMPLFRRAKSLDRRTTDSVMTPDLLNFKKGWMVKLDEQGQWKKYWFVLTDHSLRFYKDSIAEEASDLDGEIDLSTCYNVIECQAQRNYGFQIQTREGIYTLSAMTAGIRRNWIQAVMKNVRPSTAPDVASSTDDHRSHSPLVRPDVTHDSPSSETSHPERETTQGFVKSRVRERRREGRSKTFDWAEFRPIAQVLAQQRALEAESLKADIGELERSRRREERKKRFESVTSSTMEPLPLKDGGRTDVQSPDRVPQSPDPQIVEMHHKVEEVIEQHWRQVEKTPIREERRVPLPLTVPAREAVELEKLLENYKKGIEDLKTQLEGCHQQLLDSNKHKQQLELQLRTALEREHDIRTGYISPLEHHLGLEAEVTPQMKRPELATCERGFAAMEVSHQKVIDELQRKHQRELENLHEEKERLLAEETAATISAIEAMKNAHRNELEKELDKARKANSNTENADVEEIRRQHDEELCSYQREIEVLSEQYSQKCLENAHLAHALEAERQALRQCQRENQELNAHNQELNNRLAAEITKMRSMTSEDGLGDTNAIQGKELYELEVMLRVKESEVQYLKQEINSLKDELQAAQRDKKYATDKYKDIYTELSIVKAKAERDLGRLRDQLQLAHEALGEPSLEEVDRGGGYDIMKSKSNPDILKMAAAAAKRSERTMRSKSLKEGLTPEQRLHLFENKDTKEF
ncbi:myosin phosphatase Rho-interacting protein isoform X5 [Corythoichthys intestinalis]|uniref:myosin phosphatase Rho-interacting protein isoform X5 n=1 Tax=Corythoichthys intestinalis TaxID=161448 RepID=UPI0025A624AE|nr:myosin phosphatase Rho-interacting protein isoform X5 [Corythoichthys intestinalis]